MKNLLLIKNLLGLSYNIQVISEIFPLLPLNIQLHLANKLGNENLKHSKKNVISINSLISFGMTLDAENSEAFNSYFL